MAGGESRQKGEASPTAEIEMEPVVRILEPTCQISIDNHRRQSRRLRQMIGERSTPPAISGGYCLGTESWMVPILGFLRRLHTGAGRNPFAIRLLA